MKKTRALTVVLIAASFTLCCESDLERRIRLEEERQERLVMEREQAEQHRLQEAADLERKAAQEKQRQLEEQQKAEELRRLQEQEAERARQQQILEDYGNHSIGHGAVPWRNCFGGNASCEAYGCSKIEVNASYDSDVMVVIKQGGRVKKHAYIQAGRSYTFEMPNGYYQPFFYSGRGWYPEKDMDSKLCATLKGGFIYSENWGKDDPQYLNNTILTYTLREMTDGNFSTRPSDESEAL